MGAAVRASGVRGRIGFRGIWTVSLRPARLFLHETLDIGFRVYRFTGRIRFRIYTVYRVLSLQGLRG